MKTHKVFLVIAVVLFSGVAHANKLRVGRFVRENVIERGRHVLALGKLAKAHGMVIPIFARRATLTRKGMHVEGEARGPKNVPKDTLSWQGVRTKKGGLVTQSLTMKLSGEKAKSYEGLLNPDLGNRIFKETIGTLLSHHGLAPGTPWKETRPENYAKDLMTAKFLVEEKGVQNPRSIKIEVTKLPTTNQLLVTTSLK